MPGDKRLEYHLHCVNSQGAEPAEYLIPFFFFHSVQDLICGMAYLYLGGRGFPGSLNLETLS